jgi:TRAP-type C4-dicarboxylate transport system substrate-binding protein
MKPTMRGMAGFAALVTVAALAGCGDGGSATKAGGSGGPLTLRLATLDDVRHPAVVEAKEFARRVQALSHGRIRVEPVTNAVKPHPDYERRLTDKVASGELELGVMPAQFWERAGVTSLRALYAPFLITTNALLAEIVSGEEATDMLSGLERAGVVGLGLVPEGLDHPVGFDAPLLGLADFNGRIPNSRSKTTTAVLEALGATVVQGENPDRRLHIGTIGGYRPPPEGPVTGNVFLFARADVIVINARAHEQLDEEQRSILVKAADEVRASTIASTPDDPAQARAYCESEPGSGRVVVLASDADVAALKAATAPVYAELEHDVLTRRVIERIRQRKRTERVATPTAACGESAATLAHATATSALDGTYRVEVTDEELRAEGAPDLEVIENRGVWTWTLSGGEYCWEQKTPTATTNNPDTVPEECGSYGVDGDRLLLRVAGGPDAVWRWRRTAGGDLRFTVETAGAMGNEVARALVSDPWKRIGDG